MECWIRSGPERHRLVFVQNVVLNVAHFVMSRHKIVRIDRCALFDAKIASIAEVPRLRMAHNHPIRGLFDDCFAGVTHIIRLQSQTLVEAIGLLEYFQWRVLMRLRKRDDENSMI